MSGAPEKHDRRAAILNKLGAGGVVDLLVVGGGVTGAGIALEAARTGVLVLLVDAADFASGTSSRSSKLVHGGLRYLRQGQLLLMREAIRERMALLRDAPGLVNPLHFVLPIRREERQRKAVYGAGLALYDLFAGARTRTWLDVRQVLEKIPHIKPDGLIGGWEYLDAETDDSRLVLRTLQEAELLGALALNYCRVEDWLHDGDRGVRGAVLRDVVSDCRVTVSASCVINATGVWSNGLDDRLGARRKIRPLRGSHLLFPQSELPLSEAVAFPHPDDGRPVFAAPWEGAAMVGTTDLDHREDLRVEPAMTREETDYLMAAVTEQFPELKLTAEKALSSWSGLRPVISSGKPRKPSDETREHFIGQKRGVITVCGGKLTTFRAMAREVLHQAENRLPKLKHAKRGPIFMARSKPPCPEGWSETVYGRMLGRFGDRLATLINCAAEEELALIPETQTPLAELRYACRHEAVVHLDDLLLRRTRLGLLLPRGGDQTLSTIEGLVKDELGWDEARWRAEVDRYRDIIGRSYSVPEAAA